MWFNYLVGGKPLPDGLPYENPIGNKIPSYNLIVGAIPERSVFIITIQRIKLLLNEI
mgnify:CR=1 FL=1